MAKWWVKKIKCAYPYDGYVGYINTNPENRKIILMYKYINGIKTFKLITLAKYLIETNFKIIVPENYEIDHVNNDKTDNRLENSQMIPKWLNILKQQYDNNDFIIYKIKCPICNRVVDKTKQEILNVFFLL